MSVQEIGLFAPLSKAANMPHASAGNRAADSFEDAMRDSIKSSEKDYDVEDSKPKTDNDSVHSSQDAEDTANAVTEKPDEQYAVEEGTGQRTEGTNTDKPVEELAATGKEVEEKLIAMLTDTLDISEEELLSMLEQMGIQVLDLLDMKQLNQLILQATGSKDMMALISNPALSNDILSLMQNVKAMGNQLAEMGMRPEDLTAAMEQVPKQIVTEGEIPKDVANVDNPLTEDGKALPEQAEVPDELVHTDKNSSVTREGTKADTGTTEAVKVIVEDQQSADTGESNQQSKGSTQQELFDGLMERLNVVQNVNGNVSMEEIDGVKPMDVVRQIVEQIKIQIKPEVTSLEMQLNPEHLGKVSVSVSTNPAGTVTAQFAAENEQVKKAIESQMTILKQSLEEQGVKINTVEVVVKQNPFDHKFQNQQQEKQQQQGQHSRRAFRSDAGSIIEEVQVDDQELLATQGASVSYQA